MGGGGGMTGVQLLTLAASATGGLGPATLRCNVFGKAGGCPPTPSDTGHITECYPWGGGGGWHKASVSNCLPLAAPIGLSPLHMPTLCGPERVLVVSTEPPDDLSCLTTLPLEAHLLRSCLRRSVSHLTQLTVMSSKSSSVIFQLSSGRSTWAMDLAFAFIADVRDPTCTGPGGGGGGGHGAGRPVGVPWGRTAGTPDNKTAAARPPATPSDALEGGRVPPPCIQGAQPMPSHCPPDAKCEPRWHL